MQNNSNSAYVRVWDPLVRILHWSLVLAFAVAYLSGEGEDEWIRLHELSGYVVAGLVLFRLLWGFVGTRHARFSDFVFSPATVLAYTRDLLRGQAQRYLGHNPLGGVMVVALLIMLTLATLTGLIAFGAGEQAGPLAPWVGATGPRVAEAFKETHEFFANSTLILVALHIAGVVVSSLLYRENLVRAMFTGRKRA